MIATQPWSALQMPRRQVLEHFALSTVVTKVLSREEFRVADQRLRECLWHLDSLGLNDIASHVSLAVDRLTDTYLPY